MTDIKGINTKGFDHSVRPQDDLFRHTNGDWLKNEDIPADQAVHGSFYKLRDDSEDAVKAILEEAQANSKPGVSQQIGDMYASFLDEARANELGAAPIAEDLARIAKSDFAGITHLLGELERGVVSGIFGMYVNNDPGNPERYLINMYQGGLGLPDESYYHDEKYAAYRDAYVPFVATMLQHAGWSAADADTAAQTIMNFETELAKLHWNVVETRDAEKTYNLITFEHLKKMTLTFDWDAYLKGMQLDPMLLFESVV